MMTRRRATHSPASESTVAWYKIIAISFLVLTVVLLGLVIYMTTKRASITVVAKEETMAVQMAVTVGGLPGQNGIPGVVTSTVFNWSKKYFPGATESVEGTAKGEVTVYNKTSQPMALKPTTRLLTDTGVLFRLKGYTAVPPNGQVVAEVYADQPGKAYDIAPSRFIIPGLPTEMQQDIYAVSAKPMSGGGTMVGVVTQNDIDNAVQDFKEKVKEAYTATNSTSSTNFFPVTHKVLVSVVESIPLSDQKPGAKVREFTLTGTSTLILVSFDETELSQVVEKMIGSKIDFQNEKVLSDDEQPVVALSATTLTSGTAELSVTKNIVVTLNEDSPRVQDKQNYIGRNKEEIDQYVKTLPHVNNAEVKFSPSWLMRSAPNIPDKINIGVKMIK